MIKQINKISIFIYGSMIMALGLGVYGQDISYYLSDNILKVSPVYYLTATTIISIFLFLMPHIVVAKINKKQKTGEKQLALFFIINISIGTMTSLWSLFVLIMWWG